MEPLPGMSYHTNIAKHGVGFGRGEKSLGDPHVIVREDRVVEGEQRLHAIGYVGRVLLVVQNGKGRGIGRDHPHRFSPQSDPDGKEVV